MDGDDDEDYGCDVQSWMSMNKAENQQGGDSPDDLQMKDEDYYQVVRMKDEDYYQVVQSKNYNVEEDYEGLFSHVVDVNL